MPQQQYLVGLDIGSSYVRVVVGKIDEESKVPSIIGVSETPSSGIRKGVIIDIDEAVSTISQALEKVERMTGIAVTDATVAIGGAHISSVESHGVIAVSRADGEIMENDIIRVIDASQAISIPANREIIHVIPKNFVVDGQTGIKDPLGMTGIRLEVDTVIVQAAAPFIKNLTKAIQQAGIKINDMVLAPLAAAQAVLTKRQKELGVALVDLGGGTTGLVVFEEGQLLHTSVIPVGSAHITNDIAIGLRTSIETAEKVKQGYAHAIPREVNRSEEIDLSELDSSEEEHVSRHHVAEISEARLEEIFDLVNKELKTINRDGQLPAGVVFTGAGANLPGILELAKKQLRLPVQLGVPANVNTIIDRVEDPAYATAVGLVLWAFEYHHTNSKAPTFGLDIFQNAKLDPLKKLFKKFLP
ncbi:MAG: Cell division protein ftsA [Candidatus Doudnabacteria bacterium Gr01-1014_77]|uniref:Cell division protein FtsA n=1 Tax=Candidatus Doudnabacteria bacterium Gr01-1014_77 TaxID=2017133 RepID=A0A554JD89_9BACT|nr:MAG: Cell division protein ftsA [Candidatus Doudnabacteria bacterium Gr01-1014_77]